MEQLSNFVFTNIFRNNNVLLKVLNLFALIHLTCCSNTTFIRSLDKHTIQKNWRLEFALSYIYSPSTPSELITLHIKAKHFTTRLDLVL